MLTDPQDAFDQLVQEFRSDPRVEHGRMFGSAGLKLGDKVFAMLVKGHLVVKLSAAQAQELATAGVGEFFDPGHGRLMKQWIAVPATRAEQRRSLAEQARHYVATS